MTTRRTWRTIRDNLGRSIGVVVLIALGSFYFVAASGIGNRLDANVTQLAWESNQEDVSFAVDGTVEDVAALERASGARIEPIKELDSDVAGGELRLLSEPASVNTPVVLSGRGLQAPSEVLLDPRFLAERGLRVGDRIDVRGTGLDVVGTAAVAHYVYALKSLDDVLPTAGFGFGVVSGADLAALSAGDARRTYAARFTDRADVDGQVRTLHGLVSGSRAIAAWTDADDNKRISMPQGNIASLTTMSLPVATVFFLLGALIVGVIAARSVRSDRVVIGALYALGYHRGEITRHHLALPVTLTAAGGLLGALLAVPCIQPVIDFMTATYVPPDPGPAVPWAGVAVAVALPSAMVAVATLLATRRLLGTSPVDLMRGAEPEMKVGARLPVRRLPFAVRFRIRGQLRSVSRVVFTVLGVSVASAVLLFGFTYQTSMDTVSEQGALARYE